MKKLSLWVLAVLVSALVAAPAYASDWDVAGKVLTGVEGLRIISGGRIDPVGSMISVVFGGQPQHGGRPAYGRRDEGVRHRQHMEVRRQECVRVWVPHYLYRSRYVPQHYEYSEYYHARVLVPGGYIQEKIENGGHWETRCDAGCGQHHRGH